MFDKAEAKKSHPLLRRMSASYLQDDRLSFDAKTRTFRLVTKWPILWSSNLIMNTWETDTFAVGRTTPSDASERYLGFIILRVYEILSQAAKEMPIGHADSGASYPRLLALLSDLATKVAEQVWFCDSLSKIRLKIDSFKEDQSSIKGKQGVVLVREKEENGSLLPLEVLEIHGNVPGGGGTYIALGSNIGDRIGNLETACRELSRMGVTVLRTSALYETKPMYIEDQNAFMNGVCEVSGKDYTPLQLLHKVKTIEKNLGRQKTIEKGPRNIDLDLLLHRGTLFEDETLSIPHKAMLEREFVLRPLCDLIPNDSLPQGQKQGTFQQHLAGLPKPFIPVSPTTPYHPILPPLTPLSKARPTHLMAILNLTPDSFSDGGLHSSSPTSLLPTIRSIVASGATILDIGGQSTRPHASEAAPLEELARILPTIQMIRSLREFTNLAISVDTYRASVASAAIAAGANIINDVSAGTMDSEMLPTAAKLGCTIVLMHMRGTPNTMTSLTSYPDGLIATVAAELLPRVHAAEAAGIFRWRIMLDPGIGFAKTEAQNLEILRRLDELRDWDGLRGFPWVVGASRKGFIGKITGVKEPAQRGWGTAGTVAAAVQGGADVVRVHDVAEMAQVAKMCDAIWRV